MKKHCGNKKATTRQWFSRWSNEYDRTLGSLSFHRELLDLVVSNTRVAEGDQVLDLGCGTGLLSLRYARKPCVSITGVDYSREMVKIFRDKIRRLKLGGRVSARWMDAAALKFKNNSFNKVASSLVLHHLRNKLPAFKKVFRVLKPGGIFVLGEVDMDTTGRHDDVNRLKRILKVQEHEWIVALREVGVGALIKMFDNGKKHIQNEGEYCLSLKQWAHLCRKAGFKSIYVKKVLRHKDFGIVVARKP